MTEKLRFFEQQGELFPVLQVVPGYANIPCSADVHEGIIDEKCFECKRPFNFFVDSKDHLRWQSGKGTVDALFPDLSEDEVSMLKQGCCHQCYMAWIESSEGLTEEDTWYESENYN